MFFEDNHGNNDHVINCLIQCSPVQGNLVAALDLYQQEILANFIPQIHDEKRGLNYFQQDGTTVHSDNFKTAIAM